MTTTLWSDPPDMGWHHTQNIFTGPAMVVSDADDVRESDLGNEAWLKSNAYLSAAADANFNPAGDFGICGWLRWGDEGVGGWHVLCAHYTATGSNRSYLLGHVSGNNRFYVSTNGSTVKNASIALDVNKSQRVCFMGDYDESTGIARVSVNGLDWDTSPSTGGGAVLSVTQPLYLGRFEDSSPNISHGGVGPVYFYNRKFTDQEKTDFYNNGFPIQAWQQPTPSWDGKTVVVDGSSLEWGYGGTSNINWQDRSCLPWPKALQDYLGDRFRVDNVGGRARTLNNINDTKHAWFTNRDIDIAVIGSAINDIQIDDASAATIQGYIDSIATALTSAGIDFYFLTIAPFRGDEDWTAARQTVLETVNAYTIANYPYVDVGTMLGGGTDTLLAKYNQGDDLHWSAEANGDVAEAVGTQIRTDHPLASGGSGGGGHLIGGGLVA